MSFRSSLKKFIALRFFRLYPLHLAMLGLFVSLECVKLVMTAAAAITPRLAPFTGGYSYEAPIANFP